MMPPETETPPPGRWLAFTLRVLGTLDLLAFAAVVMPGEWIACIHEYVGLGDFPDAPIAAYLARSASALYGFYGLLLWYLAADVLRHRELIAFFARMAIALGVILLAIDWVEGLPLWWRLVEGPAFAAAGVAILLLQRGCRRI